MDERTEPNELRLREAAVRWQEVEGELVAVDLRESLYFGSNASGLLLWRALAEGASREELVARLTDAWAISEERAGADVDVFLGEAAALDLLDG